MAAKELLPRYIAFFNPIPIESLRIRTWNAMHLGKNFLEAIYRVIVYFDATEILSEAAAFTIPVCIFLILLHLCLDLSEPREELEN